MQLCGFVSPIDLSGIWKFGKKSLFGLKLLTCSIVQALDLHNGYLGRWCYWKREHVFFTLPEQAVNKVLLWSYSQQCTHLTGAATATVYTLLYTCWSSYSHLLYTCWSSYNSSVHTWLEQLQPSLHWDSVHLLEQLQPQCTLAGGATAAVYTCWSCIHLLGQCTHLLEQLQPEVYTCWDFTGDYPFRLTVWFACCLLIGPA